MGQRNAHTGIICINLHEKIFFLDILHKITKVGTRETEAKAEEKSYTNKKDESITRFQEIV